MEGVFYRRARLRWLMVLIVLLAIAPMFALHLSRVQSSREALLQQAHQQATSLAEGGVRAQQQIADHARQLTEVLARVPSIRNASQGECDEVLTSVLGDGRAWLTAIFVFDSAGRGLCGTSPAARSLDISDRGYFHEAIATGKFAMSELIVSRVTGNPIIAGALPVARPGTGTFAVIGLGIALPWVEQVAKEAGAKYSGILIVTDRSGNVIAYRPQSPDGWKREELRDHPLIGRIAQGNASVFEAADPTGTDRVFGVARMPGSGIAVAVGFNRSEVLNPIEESIRYDLILLLAVAAVSIGIALLAAEFGLLRGVRALKDAALRLKAGKIGLRVKLPSFVAGELHDLAATYNAMTAEFERLAYLDRLTGLPNRRYLERHLSRRDERGQRTLPGRQAVLAIDIDGFKPVNDGYGHAVGDRVLTTIARRIASVVDERGHFFRVGGDEFVVIAPLTKAQGREIARQFAEEIRQALDQVIELDELTFPIACSIGIAMVPDDAKTLTGALEIADAALYEAKRGGRNRVVDMAPTLVPDNTDAEDYSADVHKLRA
ncbi:MAG: GGDEF domain-containing protein [Bradyrhizobiaceae bacterium]|nr:GGDEF domain-containing protein [Bradyrhizobiaceae bacterium]